MAGIVMEVCCYDLESALNAQAAGADRIELCADRHQGGTSPSYGLMEVVRQRVKIPVFSMIRPRGGDFLYSKEELKSMIYDIQMSKELGMEGVVLGVLQKDGEVDQLVMRELVTMARPLQITFHRAFDLTPEPKKSLHYLLSLGIDRVLTSGQQATAPAGVNIIRELVQLAQGNIVIMPGAGISEENISKVLQQTGAKEFHVSASGSRRSKMEYQKDKILMGHNESEYMIEIADESRIRKFREIVDQLKINH